MGIKQGSREDRKRGKGVSGEEERSSQWSKDGQEVGIYCITHNSWQAVSCVRSTSIEKKLLTDSAM